MKKGSLVHCSVVQVLFFEKISELPYVAKVLCVYLQFCYTDGIKTCTQRLRVNTVFTVSSRIGVWL